MAEGLDFLTGCRVVLCLPADADAQAELRDRGAIAVGLGDAGRVAACHARRLAAFAGAPAVLRHHRHKFDGVWLDLDALEERDRARVLADVDEALQPGGRLLVRERGAVRNERKPGRDWPVYPGTVVGPYADLLVGCTRVLALACDDAFVDALRLRDLDAVAAGAAPPGLAADGVFVGPHVEDLPPAVLPTLFAALRARLPATGRLVVRARPAVLDERVRPALRAAHWAAVRSSRVPRDGRDALLLLLPSAAPVAPAGDLPPLPPPRPAASPTSWFDLERCERRVTSQTGEDGVLAAIFAKAGTTNRRYVEFGCGDGVQCNTRQLFLQGWQGLLMDGAERPGAADVVMHAHWIDRDNINALLDRHGVPAEPDLLSIDLDGNDYWVWQAITRRPRVVVAEYNGNLAVDRALTIPYDPAHRWDGSDFYGASLLALVQLARSKGYTLVHCTTSGVNAFFVRDDLLAGEPPCDPMALFRPANYWYRGGRSLPSLPGAWHFLSD